MKKLKIQTLSYISRVLGLNHIKFTKGGVFLFNFPMFLIPIEIISEFYLELIKVLGEEKTREILYNIGKVQGQFAIINYYKKFKVKPSIGNINFFVEQVPTIGLGNIEIVFLNKKTKRGQAKIFSSTKEFISKKTDFRNYTDFYLDGCVIGIANILLDSKKLEYETIQAENNSYIFEVFENQDFKESDIIKIKEKYSYKNISYSKKSIKTTTSIFDKIKRIDKKIFKININGAYFFEDKHFFSNMGVFSTIHKLLIEHNEKSRNILYNLGKKHAKFSINKFIKYLTPNYKNKIHELFNLYGFGDVEIIKLNLKTKYAIFKIINSPFLKTYYKMYKINSNNTEYIRGFMAEVFSFILKTQVEIIEKTNKNKNGTQIFETTVNKTLNNQQFQVQGNSLYLMERLWNYQN